VKPLYARSLDGKPPEDWQSLEEHLENAASLAGDFASNFGAGPWGKLAGLWHDLGKCRANFQARLRGESIQAQHSDLGASLALERDKRLGILLAFAIAGHHAGLANLQGSGQGLPTPLLDRLSSSPADFEVLSGLPVSITERSIPEIPAHLDRMTQGTPDSKRALEVFIRFLFSALVDADRLDSERFSDPSRSWLRTEGESIPDIGKRLDSHLASRFSGAPDSEMGKMRNRILSACREAAALAPGAFSLTVPTGGGKTLSSMAFALRHAEIHGMRRVLTVIPYTSIIEQNAKVYREALGEENVLEHHSGMDYSRSDKEDGRAGVCRHELAEENWDIPVVVTTSVQFFESLFSHRPGRCRKLHNISRSVIVLDEIQTLPTEFLLPILDMLKELIRHYGCTVVLSTATPPALAARERFIEGLHNLREIIPDPAGLCLALSRVEYRWPKVDAPAMPWEELAREAVKHPRVLVITHRRSDARDLARMLEMRAPGEPLFHLSALMCPAHRLETLAAIKKILTGSGPCRVVSTQLVEAGVDLDFPVVFRALGGLDSMVQAAGRCNREGKREKGRVLIFRAESRPPPGTPRKALEITELLLREGGGQVDVSDPLIFQKYFRRLYAAGETDAKGIQTDRQQLKFANVGRAFSLIEDGHTKTIIVPWGEAPLLLEKLREKGPDRKLFRSLGNFSVSIYPQAFARLTEAGALDEVHEGIFTLTPPFLHLYHPNLPLDHNPDHPGFGLREDGDFIGDPGAYLA